MSGPDSSSTATEAGGEALLQPLALGSRTARNRLVFGPHETNLARGRSVSDRHLAYYRRRAAGGAGVVVIEEASVHPSDWPYERAPLATASVEGWATVAVACQEEGALALAALGHAGGQGSSAYSQAPLLAPSRLPEVSTREVPKWMEPEDVAAVVSGFAGAAGLAVDAGLDGVEINAGQHSLVRQFCSGLTNHRDDEWGQDRARFAREVLEAVRQAVGPAVVVGLRLCLDEMAPWAGIVPEAGAALSVTLAPWVDYVTVVRGSVYTVSATRPDGHTEPGFNLGLARLARAALPPGVAVVAQGSIVELAQAQAVVAQGTADAVEMTRAQIAEPALGLLAQGGTGRRPRPCILCNQTCQVRDVRNPLVTCVGEPSSGHETEDPPVELAPHGWGPVRAASPVRAGEAGELLVVGAGPAGLECARVAATRGHRVQLVERGTSLGGQLRVAAAGAGRGRLGALVDWWEAECARLGVQVELGRELGPDEVSGFPGPVVLCTGSRSGAPTFLVDEGAVMVSAAELLAHGLEERGLEERPGTVLVWDPIGGPIGISVAELLGAQGRPVVLATPDLVVGNELSRSGDLAPANVRLHALGVVLAKRCFLRRVTAEGAHLEDRFSGEARTVAVTAVIDAGYRLPEDSLWRATGERLARAGDAVSPRSVHEAVLEGRRAALALDSTGPGPGGTGPALAVAGWGRA